MLNVVAQLNKWIDKECNKLDKAGDYKNDDLQNGSYSEGYRDALSAIINFIN